MKGVMMVYFWLSLPLKNDAIRRRHRCMKEDHRPTVACRLRKSSLLWTASRSKACSVPVADPTGWLRPMCRSQNLPTSNPPCRSAKSVVDRAGRNIRDALESDRHETSTHFGCCRSEGRTISPGCAAGTPRGHIPSKFHCPCRRSQGLHLRRTRVIAD